MISARMMSRIGSATDTIGRPILYATTDSFLSHFGIATLEDLPPLPEPENPAETGDVEEAEELIP